MQIKFFSDLGSLIDFNFKHAEIHTRNRDIFQNVDFVVNQERETFNSKLLGQFGVISSNQDMITRLSSFEKHQKKSSIPCFIDSRSKKKKSPSMNIADFNFYAKAQRIRMTRKKKRQLQQRVQNRLISGKMLNKKIAIFPIKSKHTKMNTGMGLGMGRNDFHAPIPSLYPRESNELHMADNSETIIKFNQHIGILNQKFETIKKEIMETDPTMENLKRTPLPIARVKKIMKSDEDVKMISQEAPFLFSKACELFIMDMTHRAWFYTKENKRKTLHVNTSYLRGDIARCIERTDIFDFLYDVIPKEDLTEKLLLEKKTFQSSSHNYNSLTTQRSDNALMHNEDNSQNGEPVR